MHLYLRALAANDGFADFGVHLGSPSGAFNEAELLLFRGVSNAIKLHLDQT